MTKSIFELPEFEPYEDRWNSRVKELQTRRAYYDGTIYDKTRAELGWLEPLVYKNIRPLYLPLARAVDVDAGIVPGGWELATSTTPDQQKARDLLFAWSQWATDGVLLVHYGALYGVSGIKVSDLRDARKVVIKPVDPTKYLLVAGAQYDDTPQMALWIEQQADADGEYEYAEVITADAVRTFRAGAPFGFDGREPEYPNALGFVPYVEVQHINVGDELGDCTFQKSVAMLDAVNEMASQLRDVVKKHAEPQWTVTGSVPADLEKSGDTVWFLPDANSKVIPVVPGVDIPGILEFIREERDQVNGSLPEMAFDELRSKDQIATATLELQLGELVIKIHRIRPNYDAAMVRALRMAARAGATMGVTELTALDDDGLALDNDRPVIGTTQTDKLNTENTFWLAAQNAVKAGCPLTVFLRMQGWNEQDISAVENNPEYQSRKSLLSMAASGTGPVNG